MFLIPVNMIKFDFSLLEIIVDFSPHEFYNFCK